MKPYKLFLSILFVTLISCQGQKIDKLFEEGNLEFQNQNYSKAIGKYSQILDIDSLNTEAYYKRASCYYNVGEFDLALSDYLNMIELNDTFPYAFCNRGFVYLEKNQIELAINDFNQQIKYHPKIAESFYGLSKAYMKMDSFKLADKYISNAIELDSTNSSFYEFRGLLYLVQRNPNLALINFNKALNIDTTFSAYNGIGLCYLGLKSFEKAEYNFKQAILLNPNFSAAYKSLGTLYLEQNNKQEAKRCFNIANKMDSLNGEH
jgi:tetratricopeptide (TPR) repeat protein